MQPQNVGSPSSSGPAPYNLTPLNPGQASQNTNALGPSGTSTPVRTGKGSSGKKVALGEIGKSGTYIFEGIITQEEYVADLTRWELIKKIEIMRRSDSTIGALLRMINWQIQATDWYIEPASDDPQDVEAADLVRQELFKRRIRWTHFLGEAFLMLPFGYQVFEKVWEYADFQPAPITPPTPKPEPPKPPKYDVNGMIIPQAPPVPPDDPEPIEQPKRPIIGIAKLAGRKQRSIYKWETIDHEAGVTQYVPGSVFSIPMSKLLIFTFQKEGDNFEGISLLRQVYKNWDMKDKIELIDAMAHEKQGLGVMEVITPGDAPQPEKDAVFDAAEEVRANEKSTIMHDEGYVVEWMDNKANTQTQRLESIEYHNGQIFMSILGQFMMLGQRGSKGASGSRSTSEDQSKFFEMGLEAIAKEFAGTINNDLIPELCDYNFSNLKQYPTLEHSKIGDENIEAISDAMGKLLQYNGITMDADTEQWIRTILHAPDLNEKVRADYDNRIKNIGQQDLQPPVGAAPVLQPGQQGPPNMPSGKEPVPGDPTSDDQHGSKGKNANPDKNSSVTASERMYDVINALRQARNLAIEAAEAEYERSRTA